MMEIAHFFWHGPPLSIYEKACIASFVRHGFDVKLWCYAPVDAPKGAALCDAREILPEDDTGKFNQDGRQGEIRAFANSFRYHLLKERDGWWFDTDLLCLADSGKFAGLRREKPIVCGFENKTTINNAVLSVADKSIADAFLSELAQSAETGPWGYIGPQLVTRVLKKFDLLHIAEQPNVFYPIHWTGFDIVFLQVESERAARLCDGALTYHIWNEYMNRLAVPKNMRPPEGSYLGARFLENLPECAALPALPAETLTALISGYNLRARTEEFIRKVRTTNARPHIA